MIVTINTDASYVHQHKKGSYAFWIVSNHGRVSRAGVLKGEDKCPVRCEIKAIFNALFFLNRKLQWPMIQRIIINTDCMNAIHVYKNDMKAIKKYKLDKIYKEFTTQRNTFNQFTTQKGIMVEFRHVKAHERTDTARTYVNDWCDKNAKKALFSWIVKNKIAE